MYKSDGPYKMKQEKSGVLIEEFDQVSDYGDKHRYSLSFSRDDVSQIGKRARDELSTFLHDVHGDRPVFEYPVISYDKPTANSNYKTIGKQLWKYLSKDILDKYKPLEKVYPINA